MKTMYAMFSYGQTIDPVTVLDQMKVRGVYQENNDAYVAEGHARHADGGKRHGVCRDSARPRAAAVSAKRRTR